MTLISLWQATVACPHCAAFLQIDAADLHWDTYGSPAVRCINCKNIFAYAAGRRAHGDGVNLPSTLREQARLQGEP